VAVLCQQAVEWSRLKIEPFAQHWSELSAYCVAVMLRMSFSWWYTLSTSMAEEACKVSSCAAVVATVWMPQVKAGCGAPSWFMASAAALAQVRALVRSTIMARSILSANLLQCNIGS
jgi:hypothetical protein